VIDVVVTGQLPKLLEPGRYRCGAPSSSSPISSVADAVNAAVMSNVGIVSRAAVILVFLMRWRIGKIARGK
jgi:hypothetical protein